jgi:type VI secretion system secreted protein Hcp
MARDIFLKLDGIDGESTDSKHGKEIEILNWSWGENQLSSIGSGSGAGSGKVSFGDASFAMYTNVASPKLFLACILGDHIPEAKLTARKAGGGQQEYFVMTLKDIIISSYQTGGSSGGDLPVDSFTLNFAEVGFEYFPQKADGSLDGPVKTGYSIATNKKK